jgi:hypothetical protein
MESSGKTVEIMGANVVVEDDVAETELDGRVELWR